MPPFFLALSPVWILFKEVCAAIYGFCSKPPGLYVFAALATFLAFWWWGSHKYAQGLESGRVACETAHKAAAVVEEARQSTAVQIVTKASEARTVASQAVKTHNREIVADAVARAEALPAPPAECPIAVDGASADRLRHLSP